VSRGDLVSAVDLHGLSGVIAAQGNIGKTFTYPSGQTLRLGGIDAHGAGGDILSLGAIVGDVNIDGGLRGGRIAALGGITGNLSVHGGLDAGSAIVSGGAIGDAGLGTRLTVDGDNRGIIAAAGDIVDAAHLRGVVYNDVGATPGDPNAAAIDAVFTEPGAPVAFDLMGLDLAGLDAMLRDLAALHVGSDGNLTGPR
jgi:hypothetical protein